MEQPGNIADVLPLIAVAALLATVAPSTAAEPTTQPSDQAIKDPSVAQRIEELRNGNPEQKASAAVCLGIVGAREAIPALLHELKTGRGHPSYMSGMALGWMQEPRAVKPLLTHLRNPNSEVNAAVRLGQIGDPNAIPTLIDMAMESIRKSERNYDVERALEYLGGAEEARTLLKLLSRPDLKEMSLGSSCGADLLSTMGGPEIEPELLKLLSRPPQRTNERIQTLAVIALGKIRSTKAVPQLFKILADPKQELVHADALDALAEIRAPGSMEAIRKHLSSENLCIACTAVELLSKLGDRKSIPGIVALAAHPFDVDEDWLGPDTAEALIRLGDKRGLKIWRERWPNFAEYHNGIIMDVWAESRMEGGEEVVVAIAREGREEERTEATQLLAERASKEHLPLFVSLLDDKSSGVQGAACKALGAIGDPKALDRLIACLDKDRDRRVRYHAVQAISAIGDPNANALEPLMALSDKDKDKRVRHYALQAIGSIGDLRAVKPLARRLPNAPESDRRSIIRALGELGDANALPALRDACKAWPGNRADAAMAMHRLGDPNGTRIFRTQFTSSDWETRRKALEALHTTEYKEFWEQAIACVDDPAASIRIYAMLLLKDLRDSNAIPALREALRADPLPFLRARAAEALAELGDRESLPLIRKRFLATRLSQARFHYAAALGKLDPANGIPLIASRLPKLPRAYQFALISRFDEFDTPHAFKALQKLAQSRDPHLRDSAEWALSCIRRKRAAAKAAKQKAE